VLIGLLVVTVELLSFCVQDFVKYGDLVPELKKRLAEIELQ